jgi:hypothetical protein
VQIDLLKAALHHRPELSPYPFQFLDQRRKTRVLDLYRTLAKNRGLTPDLPTTSTDPIKLSRCLLRGYPDRVAQRREIDNLYNFCQGRGGIIGKESFVANRKPALLVVVDAVESLKKDAARGITIRACSTLHMDILKEDPGHMLKSIKKEEFDSEKGIQTLRRELYYGTLKIESQYLGPAQVTGDLIGFWAGSYCQVHKELSRRYPKHHWPENPAQAKPVALKRLLK